MQKTQLFNCYVNGNIRVNDINWILFFSLSLSLSFLPFALWLSWLREDNIFTYFWLWGVFEEREGQGVRFDEIFVVVVDARLVYCLIFHVTSFIIVFSFWTKLLNEENIFLDNLCLFLLFCFWFWLDGVAVYGGMWIQHNYKWNQLNFSY